MTVRPSSTYTGGPGGGRRAWSHTVQPARESVRCARWVGGACAGAFCGGAGQGVAVQRRWVVLSGRAAGARACQGVLYAESVVRVLGNSAKFNPIINCRSEDYLEN